MKIATSNLQLTSEHRAISQRTLEESLKTWTGDTRPDFEGRASAPSAERAAVDPVSLSPRAKAEREDGHATRSAQAVERTPDELESDVETDPHYRMMMLLVEKLTGHKIRLVRTTTANAQPPAAAGGSSPQPAQPPAEAPARAGFGVEYDRHETLYEAEQTTFSARGTVQTADGKSIGFAVDLAMSREHFEQSDVSVRLGDAKVKDPLVINFGGTAAQLTDTKFDFDLDSDGKAENISFVAPGSGFLALDKNGDGTIGNGKELFGAATGDAFAELAAYDGDGNGWIDENDAVFDDLRVWTRDAAGTNTYRSLAEANVGAVNLGHVSTSFDLKNAENRLDGQVRATGVYLSETGEAGTVQQVDLAV
jgi:hypothetical protein